MCDLVHDANIIIKLAPNIQKTGSVTHCANSANGSPSVTLNKLTKLKTAKHRFPIETWHWENIDIPERKCFKCNDNRLSDEFHFLFECSFFKSERHKYLEEYYYKRPNKLNKRMHSNDPQVLIKLSIFVTHRLPSYSQRGYVLPTRVQTLTARKYTR